jgi:hypothetical protein
VLFVILKCSHSIGPEDHKYEEMVTGIESCAKVLFPKNDKYKIGRSNSFFIISLGSVKA